VEKLNLLAKLNRFRVHRSPFPVDAGSCSPKAKVQAVGQHGVLIRGKHAIRRQEEKKKEAESKGGEKERTGKGREQKGAIAGRGGG